MKRLLLNSDWDVMAGIAAAVLGLLLHLFHGGGLDVQIAVILLLCTVLLLRDLRGEGRFLRLARELDRVHERLRSLQDVTSPADVVLLGPKQFTLEYARFASDAHGTVTWYNFCSLMMRRQTVFDNTLRLLIDNPHVHAIRIICNHPEQPTWEADVAPKIALCAGAGKVHEPVWADLPETVSFLLADLKSHGQPEVLLSFWGEPFMLRSADRTVPRYIMRVQSHCELIGRLTEMVHYHRH